MLMNLVVCIEVVWNLQAFEENGALNFALLSYIYRFCQFIDKFIIKFTMATTAKLREKNQDLRNEIAGLEEKLGKLTKEISSKSVVMAK